MSPTAFPRGRSLEIVLSIPNDVVGEQMSGLTANDVRTALLTAFVANDFRVKDGGFITPPPFDTTKRPVSDRKESYVRGPDGQGSVAIQTEEVRSGEGGMTFHLTDPTSLWAPDLMDYPDLQAEYFFRIFELSVERSEAVMVEVERNLTQRQISDYAADVDAANAARDQLRQDVAAYREKYRAYQSAYGEYLSAFDRWIDDNRKALVLAGRGRPQPEPALDYVEPRVPAAYDLSALEADARVNMMLDGTKVTLVAEVIETSTGEVAWIGESSAFVPSDDRPERQRLTAALTAMVLRIRTNH